jgi:NADH-quinone oxidoreductase subunit L
MSDTILVAVLLLSPLLGFMINGTLGRSRFSGHMAGLVATLAAAISFLSAILLVANVTGLSSESRALTVKFFDWIQVGSLNIPAQFVIDPISGIMILLVTGVGSLIHLFSIGYMHDDPGVAKYFAYLNLFLFNMLVLVTGDSLPLLFVGWEGVGLCSYLLIGFWFQDREKAAAGMKAFIVNRVGDAAFLLGMFILFTHYGTLNLRELNLLAPADPIFSWFDPLVLGTLFLFIGATGKSAQIPLYVWLPDAMAGPTPVSALIHAATMVTAGVYMIVRLSFLYMAAPYTMMLIAIIGAVTVVMAASIGLTQWDIKKVLAYSTVSQLGYLFLACGVGAFGAALFHLLTHAFFKALMFLGSGSVIHAMHHEQDMKKMGGLRKYLPITHWTFLAGWVAIIGLPPFAGFFSKDEILWLSYHSDRGHFLFWIVGALGALLTSFYMTRLMALTFWGKPRFDDHHHPPHESGWTMTVPLIVLAVLSVVGGWIGIPHVIAEVLPWHPENKLEHWLGALVAPAPTSQVANAAMEWSLMGISVVGAMVSAFLAYLFYCKMPRIPEELVSRIQSLHRVVSHKYYVDEFYQAVIVKPLVRVSEDLWFYVDVRIIDRVTYWLSDLSKGLGEFSKAIQTGNLQTYALYIVLGLASLLMLFLVL